MVKKLRKQYETPTEGWSEERIQREDELIDEFGLKNKREVYKAQSELRSLRREARKLVAAEDDKQKQDLIEKVYELGLVKQDSGLEDILTLNVTDILERRLQSAVDRKGFADTPNEARQLVTHGHVFIDGKRVNIPGYLLTQEEEKELELRMPEPSEDEEEDTAPEEESDEEEDSEETEDVEESDEEQEAEDSEEETEEEEAEETETEEQEEEESEESGDEAEEEPEETAEDETEEKEGEEE